MHLNLVKRGLLYVASPYTKHPGGPEKATQDAAKITAKLMLSGYAVFSPVVHSHGLIEHLGPDLQFDHDFWMRQDIAVLRQCAALIAVKLPGWQESRGMARELEEAKLYGIQVIWLEPEDVYDA